MKKVQDWIIPDREASGIVDILREWENKHLDVLSLVPNKGLAVQAGGYVGVFPKNLSYFFNKVLTFEPVEENWNCLIKNIQEKNIVKINAGLGNCTGKAKIKKIIPNNCGAIQLESENDGDISIVCLDDYISEQVDLLWLDIEGYEVKALQGAKNTIKKYTPVIVLENNGLIPEFPGSLDGSIELRNWMKEVFGYSFVKRIMRDDIFIYKDKL